MLLHALWGLVVVVAIFHVGFLFMEMFRWTTFAVRVAGLDPATAEATKPLGLNQGLYNGFLTAGLLWSLHWPPPAIDFSIARFFLVCVVIAGVVGTFTVKPPNWGILGLQTFPALLALLAMWLT